MSTKNNFVAFSIALFCIAKKSEATAFYSANPQNTNNLPSFESWNSLFVLDENYTALLQKLDQVLETINTTNSVGNADDSEMALQDLSKVMTAIQNSLVHTVDMNKHFQIQKALLNELSARGVIDQVPGEIDFTIDEDLETLLRRKGLLEDLPHATPMGICWGGL